MNEFRWLFVDFQVRCRPKSEARRGAGLHQFIELHLLHEKPMTRAHHAHDQWHGHQRV